MERNKRSQEAKEGIVARKAAAGGGGEHKPGKEPGVVGGEAQAATLGGMGLGLAQHLVLAKGKR